MPISIAGDGTISGVSVGGLPDGIVDTDMLAADAVTDAKQSLSGAAKAWVNFNGTGTVAIRDSYNVSSITDNGTGDYTVSFTNAMANANYCVPASGAFTSTDGASWVVNAHTFATSSFKIDVINPGVGREDPGIVSASVFGN